MEDKIEELLVWARNYLDITYADEEMDKKLIGMIKRGSKMLENIAGDTLEFTEESPETGLLLDYCRYARDAATEEFAKNFQSELLQLRLTKEGERYAKKAEAGNL